MGALPIFLIFTVLSSFNCAPLTWQQINTNSTLPEGRRDHAMGYDGIRNKLVVYGGRGGSGVFGDTWIFDLNNGTWRQISVSTSPPARFSMVYGLSNDMFYIASGQIGSTLFNDIWRFDLSSLTWTELTPSGVGPEKLYGATGGFFSNSSNEFFFTHGFSFTTRYANTFIYDITKNSWNEIMPDRNAYHFNHPSPRCIHSGTMIASDRHLIYGGCLSGGQTGGACPSMDSWILSSSKREWMHLEECASPRTYSSLALLPAKSDQLRVVLYGGTEDNNQVLIVDKADKDQVAIFNVNKEEWSLRRASGTPPNKRHGAAMIPHPQGLIMFGGGNMNDLWMLVGDTDSADETPLHSQECKKPFAGTLNLVMLHGVFMVMGWGILLQAGAFIARYLRFKDPLWFHLHRVCQVSGLAFALAGFICGVRSVRFDHFKFAHGGLGLFIMIIGLQQPFNALIRPHKKKGEEVSLKRKIWEVLHINIGRLALILVIVEISLGLFLAQAHKGHHIAWYVYMALLILAYIIFEAKLQYKKFSGSSVSANFEMR